MEDARERAPLMCAMTRTSITEAWIEALSGEEDAMPSALMEKSRSPGSNMTSRTVSTMSLVGMSPTGLSDDTAFTGPDLDLDGSLSPHSPKDESEDESDDRSIATLDPTLDSTFEGYTLSPHDPQKRVLIDIYFTHGGGWVGWGEEGSRFVYPKSER